MFGKNLRQAREARNMTLQEIAASTKISSRALQALEDERFDLLPGGIFNKGFVRAYARCVGLDEEQTVAEYLAAAKVAMPEVDMQAMSTQVSYAREASNDRSGFNAATVVGVLAVIVALGLGALWLKEQRKEARELAATQHPVENQGGSASAPTSIPAPPTVVASEPNATSPVTANSANQSAGQNAATSAASNVTPNVAQNAPQMPSAGASAQPAVAASKTGIEAKAPAAPVEISISATARAWISVRSDGKPVETLTLDPEKPEASTRSYHAREKLVLTVGNPAGLSVIYNGKPTGKLGPVGQPTTITFTPQGMEKQ